MRIAVDAMGGDNAPMEIVKGAVQAAGEFGCDITLVGREDEVESCLMGAGASDKAGGRIEVFHAPDVIEMDDDPSMAVRRKREASMSVALTMLAQGKADAVVSAGNTGALLSGSTLLVKRVKGIRRAAVAPVLPNGGRGVVLIDAGANAECTPGYLLQFGFMGAYYAEKVLGIENPKVGLINIGTEENKGTGLQRFTYELLEKAAEDGRINFVGNVESRDVLTGRADVLVSDGFVGNIILKAIEGAAGFIMGEIKNVLSKNMKTKLAASMVYSDLKELKKMMDSSEVGGTAFLGIKKPVIKAHGSSDARAIRNAVRQAVEIINSHVIEDIESNAQFMQVAEE